MQAFWDKIPCPWKWSSAHNLNQGHSEFLFLYCTCAVSVCTPQGQSMHHVNVTFLIQKWIMWDWFLENQKPPNIGRGETLVSWTTDHPANDLIQSNPVMDNDLVKDWSLSLSSLVFESIIPIALWLPSCLETTPSPAKIGFCLHPGDMGRNCRSHIMATDISSQTITNTLLGGIALLPMPHHWHNYIPSAISWFINPNGRARMCICNNKEQI